MLKILFIAPFQSSFPPMNGGHLRATHLSSELSKYFEVHYLSLQENAEEQAFKWNSARCSKMHFHSAEIELSQSGLQRIKNALQYRWMVQRIFTDTDSALLALKKKTSALLQQIDFDLIVLTSLPPIAFNHLRRHFKVPIIFDAHNVDSTLIRQHIAEGPEKQARLKQYAFNLKKERNLYRYCDGAFACSRIDQEQLESLNGGRIKIFTIPNGTDISINRFKDSLSVTPLNILFCGSLNYAPNRDGLLWFYQEIFPLIQQKIPSAELTIIGKSGDLTSFEELRKNQSIHFIGEVEDVRPYYEKATVSIIPLRLGSGTRLKILEAMSLGIPIISTTQGAEGIEAEAGTHIRLADTPETFAENTAQLLKSPESRESIRTNARAFVEAHYDWKTIGKDAEQAILRRLNK